MEQLRLSEENTEEFKQVIEAQLLQQNEALVEENRALSLEIGALRQTIEQKDSEALARSLPRLKFGSKRRRKLRVR